MNQLQTGGAQFTSREMELMRNTVAKDCNQSEFDMFIHICKHTGLDPLRRQIYAFVFNQADPKKRQMVPVVAIGGLRSMAERTGNYRPDMDAPRIEYSDDAKNPDSNPLGIVKCNVTVYKFSHGEWFPANGEAYWDEYVPLWNDKIDQKKTGWVKMPRIMIAKCAEAAALRKAWPDDFANLYEESELDQARTLDLSPSEMADLGGQEKRLEQIGGPNAIMLDWLDGKAIDRVPLADIGDRLDRFISENASDPTTLKVFEDRNKHAMQEFWARSKSDALEIKRKLEKVYAATADSGESAEPEVAHEKTQA